MNTLPIIIVNNFGQARLGEVVTQRDEELAECYLRDRAQRIVSGPAFIAGSWTPSEGGAPALAR